MVILYMIHMTPTTVFFYIHKNKSSYTLYLRIASAPYTFRLIRISNMLHYYPKTHHARQGNGGLHKINRTLHNRRYSSTLRLCELFGSTLAKRTALNTLGRSVDLLPCLVAFFVFSSFITKNDRMQHINI